MDASTSALYRCYLAADALSKRVEAADTRLSSTDGFHVLPSHYIMTKSRDMYETGAEVAEEDVDETIWAEVRSSIMGKEYDRIKLSNAFPESNLVSDSYGREYLIGIIHGTTYRLQLV